MKRLGTTVGAAALAITVLTGCGGSDFCETGEEEFADVSGLNPTDPEDVTTIREKFEALRDEAPAEIEDDFDVVVDGLKQVEDAGDDPAAAADFDAAAYTGALQNIERYVDENC